MSLTNFNGINNYLPGTYPVAQVTPFTYREGATMLHIIDSFKEWAKLFGPQVNEIINNLIAAMDDTENKWSEKFDLFMQNVISELEEMNDQAAANLVRDAHSKLRGALDERYATLEMLRMSYITPQMFGAKGDGKTDDTDALHQFFAALSSSDNYARGFIPSGEYWYNRSINLTENESGFECQGSSVELAKLMFNGTGTPLMGIGSKGIMFRDFTIDAGFNVTRNVSHGASFRNPIGVSWDNVKFTNYASSSLLMFANDGDEDKYGYSNINRTVSDGTNIANNGLNVVNLRDVFGDANRAYNGGTSVANSPSYGIQLKNICRNVHLTNSYAEGWKGGLVMASDGNVGPKQCSLTGSTRNCHSGVLLGKAEQNKIEAFVDSPTERAVNFGANSQSNTVYAILSNIPASIIPVRHGFHNNTVIIENVLNFAGAKIFELTPSATFNKNVIITQEGSIANPSSYVLDNSGRDNNSFVSYDSLAKLCSLNEAGAGYLFFDTPSKHNSWLSYNHATSSFGFRANGKDVLLAQPTTINAGLDNESYLGSAARRWKGIYAVDAAINTSDEREKRDVEIISNLSPELRAWEKVEYVKYRWIESVQEKGDNARIHFGVIAQQVKRAFESEGLDPFEYGILCYDEWPDDDHVEAGNRFGVRYQEALVLEMALLRSKLGL